MASLIPAPKSHSGKWTTIREPVDLKVVRTWKTAAEMRASATESNDAPVPVRLSDRDRRGTVFGGADYGFGDLDSSAQALASARSNAVEHAAADNLLAVGSLQANLQKHRHDARKLKLFKEHDYTYLRENIRKSEDRINRIKSGVSIYEIVELEKQQVKKPDVAKQHVQQQQSRQSPDASSGNHVHERDFSAHDVPTFGGTRERFQPVIALSSDAAQDAIDASTISERQKKLLQLKQSETQFTLPRDLQELIPQLSVKQEAKQQLIKKMQDQSADAQRSAVAAPRSSVVMFSPASEVAFERNDLVDALLTSRAALAEPLYGAFARSAPSSSPQKSSARGPSTLPSPQSHRPLGPRADSNQFSSNARARQSVVAPVTPASYRSIRNSLDLRLRQSEVATSPALWKSPHPTDSREANSIQPVPAPAGSPAGKGGRRSVAIASPSAVLDSSASAPTSRPGSARGSARFATWKIAERASIQQIDALKSVCFDFDSRKESLGRSLTAIIVDLEEQRESTLQRKLVATQKLAFHSLASDLTLLRVDTDAEQRRLLFERHRNYVWFERLVRKSARVNRDMSSAEITLFLHLRDLIESVEGLYIHPGVNVNAADVMGAAVAATLDGSSLLPKGDIARTQRSTIVGTAASISYAALHLPAAAADLPRLERSMSRILSGIHADLVSQKEIVEIISFLRTDVLRLDNMRFRASLEKAGFDLDALNDAYFVTERATRSNKPGEHTSFPRAARLAPRTPHAATADSTESPRNNTSAGDRVAADTRMAVPPLSLDGEAMFRAKYMSPRAAKLRDKLLAEESANQSARKMATNSDGSEADPPASSFDLASSDEQAVLAHHFASKLASAFDSARAYLPAPEERYLTSVRSARLARIDRFVDGWETSPLPSARASRAMPPRVQQALGASLAVYVSAVREQRRGADGT